MSAPPARMLRFVFEGDNTAIPEPMDNLPASIQRALEFAKDPWCPQPARERFMAYAALCQDLLAQIQAVGPCPSPK